MKIALYIEEGIHQIVLTPQTEYEKKLIKIFENRDVNTTYFMGSFYACQGGWIRQNDCDHPESLIIVLKEKK